MSVSYLILYVQVLGEECRKNPQSEKKTVIREVSQSWAVLSQEAHFLFLFVDVCSETRLRVLSTSFNETDIKENKWYSWKWAENDTWELILQHSDWSFVLSQKFFYILIN
jgi:hypothetical protein